MCSTSVSNTDRNVVVPALPHSVQLVFSLYQAMVPRPFSIGLLFPQMLCGATKPGVPVQAREEQAASVRRAL